MFYQTVGSITFNDSRRLDKLVKKSSSVLVKKLDVVKTVIEGAYAVSFWL